VRPQTQTSEAPGKGKFSIFREAAVAKEPDQRFTQSVGQDAATIRDRRFERELIGSDWSFKAESLCCETKRGQGSSVGDGSGTEL
jgi:hypothetical protein